MSQASLVTLCFQSVVGNNLETTLWREFINGLLIIYFGYMTHSGTDCFWPDTKKPRPEGEAFFEQAIELIVKFKFHTINRRSAADFVAGDEQRLAGRRIVTGYHSDTLNPQVSGGFKHRSSIDSGPVITSVQVIHLNRVGRLRYVIYKNPPMRSRPKKAKVLLLNVATVTASGSGPLASDRESKAIPSSWAELK